MGSTVMLQACVRNDTLAFSASVRMLSALTDLFPLRTVRYPAASLR